MRRLPRIRTILGIAAATLALSGAGVFVFGGFHDLTAVRQHPRWVFWAVATVRDAVVAFDARGVTLPDGFEPRADPEAAALYQRHCVQCHGAPGVAPAPFALAMLPAPSNLPAAARVRPPEEIYWFIRNGLKMSGMPAWLGKLDPDEIWRLTAFVEALPLLSPTDYRALAGLPEPAHAAPPDVAYDPDRADPEAGRTAMALYACRTCHVIPGIVGKPELLVGPPLDEAGARRYIAGVLPNTPTNMTHWIMAPQSLDPLSAMPDLDVPAAAAMNMTAYMNSLSEAHEQ